MLHTVNQSPFAANSLATCLRLSAAGSHILLLEDGVYAALRGGEMEPCVCDAMPARTFHALDADLKARGIQSSQLIDGVDVVDYDGFVALAVQCDKVQTWI